VCAPGEEGSAKLGRRIKMLVGKPGLDGHSIRCSEQIACGRAMPAWTSSMTASA
jgi:hypothetical protein